MPDHLEDIKCQQAEEEKKNHLLSLMVHLLHLIFVVVPSSFRKKKRDSETVLFRTLSFAPAPPFIDRWWEEFFEMISKKDSFL